MGISLWRVQACDSSSGENETNGCSFMYPTTMAIEKVIVVTNSVRKIFDYHDSHYVMTQVNRYIYLQERVIHVIVSFHDKFMHYSM